MLQLWHTSALARIAATVGTSIVTTAETTTTAVFFALLPFIARLIVHACAHARTHARTHARGMCALPVSTSDQVDFACGEAMMWICHTQKHILHTHVVCTSLHFCSARARARTSMHTRMPAHAHAHMHTVLCIMALHAAKSRFVNLPPPSFPLCMLARMCTCPCACVPCARASMLLAWHGPQGHAAHTFGSAHVFTHACTRTCMHLCRVVRSGIYTPSYVHAHIDARTCTRARTHARTHAQRHANMHAR